MTKLTEQLVLKISPELNAKIDQAYAKSIISTNDHSSKSDWIRQILEAYCSFTISSTEAMIIFAHLSSAASKAGQMGNNEGKEILQEMAEKFRDIYQSMTDKYYHYDNNLNLCKEVKFLQFTFSSLPKIGGWSGGRLARIKIDENIYTIQLGVSDTKIAIDRDYTFPELQNQDDIDEFYKKQISLRAKEIGTLIIMNSDKQITGIKFTSGKNKDYSHKSKMFIYGEDPKIIFVS